MKYTIKGNGNADYGKHIINFFEKLGGVNSFAFDCYDKLYFYKDNYKRIQVCHFPPPHHTEIELLQNGMAKGVWYKYANGNYFKPLYIEDKKIIGNGIWLKQGVFDRYDKEDYYRGAHIVEMTPLTDLTEIQDFLPDGHEDKIEVNIEVDYKQSLNNVSQALKEVINKPEPTDSIEPSTEYILKLIYEKWGEVALTQSINYTITIAEYETLKGEEAKDKAENLIQKWQPKPKIWKEDGIIMISTDAPEGAVEYTQERLNGLLKLTK